ncbi:nuclear transport factor 2 family protein [Actinomadura hibisca]|uniref:nuclear transport factor 2 family protein n=1 Tax=Actinomadura hibisca TaxID=68565 RepID=UPI00082F7AEF|nr:nuclear transport factor 2 family protein [Actinomadura hibisca]
MDNLEIARAYYRAWTERAGDMSGVALADDFTFTGPVIAYQSAEDYRHMARDVGPSCTVRVRHQFAADALVCTFVDWDMPGVASTVRSVELLVIEGDRIVSSELIYDGEPVRRVWQPN